MGSIEHICSQTRCLIDKVVKKNLTEGLLLSGGLDTSILALVASKHSSLRAFTVAFRNAPALDIEFSKLVASRLNMDHKIHFF